ncbi:MAG: hypothetical protein RJA76_1064 [Bacteroidota bacterium]|jgi:hypothetical protein
MSKQKVLIGLLFLLFSSFLSSAQTISNIVAGFNVEKGVIEISYDLEGETYQGFSINLKLKQIAENNTIEIPLQNISPSLDLVFPGTKKKVEVALDNLNLDGEFIPIMVASPVKKESPKVEEKKSVVAEEKVLAKTELTETKITSEIKPEKAETTNDSEVKSPSFLRGFSVIGKSFQDLSSQLRMKSEAYMVDGNLHPVNIKLNLDTFTFSCDFVESNTGFIKLGLYFGPKSTGCESCFNVIQKNPNSRVLREMTHKNFVFSLIAIHK